MDGQTEGWMSEAPCDVNCSPELNAGVVRLREPEITSAPLKCKGQEVNRRTDAWTHFGIGGVLMDRKLTSVSFILFHILCYHYMHYLKSFKNYKQKTIFLFCSFQEISPIQSSGISISIAQVEQWS